MRMLAFALASLAQSALNVNTKIMQETLALALETTTLWCKGDLLSAEDRNDNKEDLRSMVGSVNLVDEFFKIPGIFQGQTGDAVPDFLTEHLGVLLLKGASFVFLIITLILFCSCCSTTCVKSCRCFKKERGRPETVTKSLCGIFFTIFAACMFTAVLIGWIFQAKILHGVDNAMCVISRTAETTLNGGVQGEEKSDFTGFLPAIESLDSLSANLESNSAMTRSLHAALDGTDGLSRTVVQFTGTLSLSSDTLDVGSKITLHKCMFCDEVANIQAQAVRDLNSTLPGRIDEIRSEITSQTNGELWNDLKSSFQTAASKIADIGEELAGVARDVLDLKIRRERESSWTAFEVWSCIFPIIALLFVGLVLNGCAMWKFTTEKIPENKIFYRVKYEYSRGLRNYAASGWCCNCLCVMFIFFFAGIFMILADVFASGCIFVDDLDGARLRELVVSASPNADQVSLSRGVDLYDTCLAEAGSGNLLNSIYFDRCPFGPGNCTAGELADRMSERLAQVTNMTFSNSNVSELPENKQLAKLYQMPVAALVMLDSDKVEKDGRYLILATDPRGRSDRHQGLQVGLLTGLECKAKTINTTGLNVTPAQLGLSDTTVVIPGIEDFVDTLDRFSYDVYDVLATPVEDTNPSGITCPSLGPVVCPNADATTISDLSTLRGLFVLMEACDAAKSAANLPTDATFDAQLAEFKNQIQAKIVGATVDNVKLKNAQDYLMNQNPAAQSAGRMTCDPCTAGNSLLQIKKDMLSSTRKDLNCPTFVKNTLVCDNDVENVDCTNDINGTISYEASLAKCSVAEWAAHFIKFEKRHANSVQDVDTAAATLAPQLTQNISSQLNNALVVPMQTLLTGLSSCRFLHTMKRDLLSSVCFDGPVYGLYGIGVAYLLMGVSAFLMGVLSFFLWRRAVDNITECKEPSDSSSEPAGILDLLGHTGQ